MRNLVSAICFVDDWLIRRIFQHMTDFLTNTTGKSCYWWAAQAIFAALACGIIYQMTMMPSEPLAWTIFFVLSLMVTNGFVYIMAMRADARHLQTAMPSWNLIGLFQIWRVMAAMMTLIMVPSFLIEFVSSHDMALLFVILQNVFTTFALYFLGCLPRPPRRQTKTKLAWEPT